VSFFLLYNEKGEIVNIKKIKGYRIEESSIVNDTDKKHIENYKQLTKFFESAVQNSVSEGTTNFSALHSSCIQCIRFLDNLILTYEGSVQSARLLNQTLEKIIIDNKSLEVGNE
jgi:hypothetical protein